MIVMTTISVYFLFIIFVTHQTTATDRITNAQLNTRLKLAVNDVTRESMLSNSDYFFDMKNCPYSTFDPGSVCNADSATWPLLTTFPITVSQLNLGPCSMLPAHLHRADNVVVATQGTTHTYMFPEDGGELVEQYLSPGQLTLFPRMSLHTMVNEGCTNNQLYSFLPSNDAGRLTVLNALWLFGPEMLDPLLPFLNVSADAWNNTGQSIPPVGTGAVYWLSECRAQCGIPPATTAGGNGTDYTGSGGGYKV